MQNLSNTAGRGVTREEVVEGFLRQEEMRNVSCFIAVAIGDGENREPRGAKRGMFQSLKTLAEYMGAKFYEVRTRFGDDRLSKEIFKILFDHKPRVMVLGASTGSRYVLLPTILSILWYQRSCKDCEVKVIHGIGGNGWSIEPLKGFFSTDLTRGQLRIFKIIYSEAKEELIQKYELGRSAYKIFRILRNKGLIEWKRNRIRKTLAGRLLFNILTYLEDKGVKLE